MAGPTIVYIFRTLHPNDAAQMQRDGLTVQENSAYLLPEGATLSLDALKNMQRIGPIDPAMSDAKLAVRFGIDSMPGVDEAPGG